MDFTSTFNLNGLVEAVIVIILAVASAIKYIKAQDKIEKKKSGEEVSSSVENIIKNEAEIIKYMEYMKEDSFSDRVLIFEFHNGGHYADGRLATKTSCTFEVCRHSVESIQLRSRDIQLTYIIKTIKKVFDNNYFNCEDIEILKEEDFETYRMLSTTGVKRFYIKLIRNENNNPIAFILWEYCNGNENNNVNPNTENCIEYLGIIKNKLSELIKTQRNR